MRDQEIIGLWEAYQQVHAQPEEYVDEIVERVADDTGETGRGPRLIDAYNKAPYSDDKDSAENPIPIKLKRKGRKMKGVVRKEETDLFDYLLEYLVAEGYADTNKAALAIMANMSEEWKQSIVEGVGGYDDPFAGPHTPIGRAVRSGLKAAGNVATQVVRKTVPPNIRSAVVKKAKEIASGN